MIKIADEVWLAVALLHREQPDRVDFSITEVVDRVEAEKLTSRLRPGVRVHVTTHCVAGLAPNPGRYCMLHASASGRRRLYRPGDPIHPARQGAKSIPAGSDIPEAYRSLLSWYENEYAVASASTRGEPRADPLLELRGSGRELWADEPADAYIERLRSDWS
jgi:hypothetical protein